MFLPWLSFPGQVHFFRNSRSLETRFLAIHVDFHLISHGVQLKNTLLRRARSAGRVKNKKYAPNLAETFGSIKEGLYSSLFKLN